MHANFTFIQLQAHALYNSIGFRCENDPMWASKAFEIQQKYWNGSSNIDEQRSNEITLDLSDKLCQLRKAVGERLYDTKSLTAKYILELKSGKDLPNSSQEGFCQEMKELSLHCTEKMVQFCQRIFEFSLQALADKPPCAFCVVALGSFARGEMTPYSDFEYIILVERQDEKSANYFQKFAMTSYFFIGNLRETTLNTMDIAEIQDWFDDRQRNGFKIDGPTEWAGNIPTGKGSSSGNTYIMTPGKLFETYKKFLDEPKEEAYRHVDLTALLQYTKEVFTYGGKAATKLLDSFLSQKKTAFANEDRVRINEAMFKNDAVKHNFGLESGLDDKGYSVEAKREIHKYPSILLYNISIVLGFTKCNSWETLAGLYAKGLISASIYESLLFLLACSCYVRHSTYLLHGAHDDRMSLLATISGFKSYDVHRNSAVAQASRRWYMPHALFVKQCEKSVPLKNHIGKCNTIAIEALLKQDIAEPTWLVKFQTLHCCHKWIDAWEVFEARVGIQALKENPDAIVREIKMEVGNDFEHLWFVLEALGYGLFQQRHYQVACLCFKTFIHAVEESANELAEDSRQKLLATARGELGRGYVSLYLHEQAVTEYEKSLSIQAGSIEPTLALTGKIKMYLGRCCRQMMSFDKAEQCLLGALRIFYQQAASETAYDYFGNKVYLTEESHQLEKGLSPDLLIQYLNNSSVMLARVLWHLAYLYFDLKYYQRSINYFRVAERMYKDVYGEKAGHKDIFATQFALAAGNNFFQEHEKADRHLWNAILTIVHIHSPHFASPLKKADRFLAGSHLYYSVIINVLRQLPGYKLGHIETAVCLQFLAFHLIHRGHHKLADKLLRDTLKMYKSITDCKEKHLGLARATSYVGWNFWKAQKVELAFESFSKVLAMMYGNSEQYAKLETAETLQNIGVMYSQFKEYQKAEHYLSSAKKLYLDFCDKNHPKIQEACSQLQRIKQYLA